MEYFDRLGQQVKNDEICALIERFDKTRDGRITFQEF